MCKRGAVTQIWQLDATALSRAIGSREVSCREVMDVYLDRIERLNPALTAIVDPVDPELARKSADERDRELAAGHRRSPFHGFPWAFKDLLEVAGHSWTASCLALRDRKGVRNDFLAERLLDGGVIPVGRTNSAELGYGSQSYNQMWGTTRNPWNLSRTPGGSSGGAASAVAARLLPIADGSDYMGSLRNPAAFCNITALRPSYGRIPDRAFFAQPMAQGPLAHTVEDLALAMTVMAGPHRLSPLGLSEDPSVFAEALRAPDVRGRIGFTGDLNGRLPMEPGVLELTRAAADIFEDLGWQVVDLVPEFDYEALWDAFHTWRRLRAAGNAALVRDPAKRALTKPEAIWEIELGLALTPADINSALDVRQRWFELTQNLFEDVDFLIAPSAQVFPFDADVHWPSQVAGRPMDTYHRWMETVVPWSMTGGPVLALPAGFGQEGLPTGIQLVGPARADLAVLRAGKAYQDATDWLGRVPEFAAG